MIKKRSFIRCLWGKYQGVTKLEKRRNKIDKDIERIVKCKYSHPFKIYVYGKDNFKYLTNMGFSCELIDSNPLPFDVNKNHFRHKMELIKIAMEQDFDEIVYLDWDCVPVKKLTHTFWDDLYKKGDIQGCLQIYKNKRCFWRKEDRRKMINGGFLYIRDRAIPKMAISFLSDSQNNDEIAWTRYIDYRMGGWKNWSVNGKLFLENYENDFCNLQKCSAYPKEVTSSKNECFVHYI